MQNSKHIERLYSGITSGVEVEREIQLSFWRKTTNIAQPIRLDLRQNKTILTEMSGLYFVAQLIVAQLIVALSGERTLYIGIPNRNRSQEDIDISYVRCLTHFSKIAQIYLTFNWPRTQPKRGNASNMGKMSDNTGEEKKPELEKIEIENLQKVSDEYSDQKRQKNSSSDSTTYTHR